MDISIKQADLSDAEEILALQKLVFRNETRAYDHCSIPPLTETLEKIRYEFKYKTFLKAISNEKIIGSMRGHKDGDTCYLEKLFVHPSLQGHGIGTRLFQEMEKYFIDKVSRIQLSTDNNNHRNVGLYQKFGYKIYKIEKIAVGVEFVYMEKNTKG